MKKFLFFLLLIIVASCDPIPDEQRSPTYPCDMQIMDSCEYLYLRRGYAGYMAHKGNCKHCAEVRQREYDALIERIKEVINRK